MIESARIVRNNAKLRECNPVFANRLRCVLILVEEYGFRPRIQEAFRTKADQLAAFQRGASDVKFGLHNMVNAKGKPDALAVDILDDNAPLNPSRKYKIVLAWAAKQCGCETGIDWDCSVHDKKLIAAAVANLNFSTTTELGWDPCHVQPSDVTLEDAIRGHRPKGV